MELTYAGKTFVYGFTVLNAPVLPATVKVSINGTALTLPAEALTRTAGVMTIQYELAGKLVIQYQ